MSVKNSFCTEFSETARLWGFWLFRFELLRESNILSKLLVSSAVPAAVCGNAPGNAPD